MQTLEQIYTTVDGITPQDTLSGPFIFNLIKQIVEPANLATCTNGMLRHKAKVYIINLLKKLKTGYVSEPVDNQKLEDTLSRLFEFILAADTCPYETDAINVRQFTYEFNRLVITARHLLLIQKALIKASPSIMDAAIDCGLYTVEHDNRVVEEGCRYEHEPKALTLYERLAQENKITPDVKKSLNNAGFNIKANMPDPAHISALLSREISNVAMVYPNDVHYSLISQLSTDAPRDPKLIELILSPHANTKITLEILVKFRKAWLKFLLDHGWTMM